MSSKNVIVFDTSDKHIAAALYRGRENIKTTVESMSKGQAERLIPLLNEILDEAFLSWEDIHRIGVCTGPGNFTGIRISVSAARGLAFGLNIPAIGISSFEATLYGAVKMTLPYCQPIRAFTMSVQIQKTLHLRQKIL